MPSTYVTVSKRDSEWVVIIHWVDADGQQKIIICTSKKSCGGTLGDDPFTILHVS